MASMSVDTLSIARELRATKMPSDQAEAIASAIGRSSVENLAQAATKADIAQLETKIEAVQLKLIMWFVSTQIAVGALMTALIKL
jgi:ribosomal protein S13